MILTFFVVIASVVGMMTGRRATSRRGFASGRGSGGRGIGNNGGRGDNDGSGGRGDTHGRGVGGHSGGASGSGESSAAGARGGRSQGASVGGRRRLRDEDENSDCVQWDDVGRQILPLGVDADQGTNGRGSTGNGGSGGNDGNDNGGPGANDGSGGRGSSGQDSGNNGGRGDNDGSGGRGDTHGSGVGEHGGSASGSGESSAAGARGGRSRGASGGQRRLRGEDENSECVHWDDAGRQIFPLGVDADPRRHRTRGYSPGGFGTYPGTPTVVRIGGNLIDCPKALRNLLAIIRMFWPDDCVGVKEIDRKSPKFWDDCIDEFLRYFTWDPQFATEDEAKASILAVLRDKLRRALADDKKRADEQKKAGGTYVQHRPLYMKPGVWSRIAKYWESDEFKKKSDAGKKARKSVKLPHTSGARSFDRRRRDYVEKHGKLNTVVVYKDCHTLKDPDRVGQWITEAAKDIIDHYISICEKKGVNPEMTQIHSWIEAVGGVRKNMIIGHPRLRPSDIYGPDARSPPPRKGEGSSGRSALARLQDDMFIRVVDETLAQARANPNEYTLTAEEVRLLARNVVEGDSSVPSDHPIARETRHAIIRVAVEVLNNIYKKDGPAAVKGKAPADDDDDVDDGNPRDEDTDSDEDLDMSAMPRVSHGGPKIRG